MSGRFDLEATRLSGLTLVKRSPVRDARGSFVRMFCMQDLAVAGWDGAIAQINLSVTTQPGTVRGMHFQYPPAGEAKFVSCLRGEVWDVAVDLRRNSPTFLQWHGERLSAENGMALLIPRGFAHGFQALTSDCELLYLHSATYAPGSEGGIQPEDPMIAIDWPRPITEMSDRDQSRALLTPNFQGIYS